MKLTDFDYELPSELIAQYPVTPRDASKLMVVERGSGKISHKHFFEVLDQLSKNDVLILNDTKVLPARLFGKKESGGKVEVLIVKISPNSSEVEFIGRNIGGAKKIYFKEGLWGEIERPGVIKFNVEYTELLEYLNIIGHTPLPPYIATSDALPEPKLRQIYQTIYAKNTGSAAAPTAGFHFTEELIQKIKSKGITMEYVTLHVGLGTFAPVKEEVIEKHHMHSEYFSINSDLKKRLVEYKASGKRIIAVGTTSVRVLESDWDKNETNIFIFPGYKFKFVDAMITNFHLPKSTLLMLVSAFAGRELIMRAYEEAVKNRYRFFSFGDAMLIV